MKRLVNQFLGLFPSRLPSGMAQFDAWVDSIIATYPMPTMDRDSLVNGIAATIMRLGPTEAWKSKVYFALIIQAGASKQIAGAQFTLLREKQKAAELAAQQKPVEATTPVETAAPTSDQPKV